MPVKPRKNETREEFVSRCIGVEVNAGKEQAQAAAICYDIWKRHKRKTDEHGLIEY